jgi:hypothetical protein
MEDLCYLLKDVSGAGVYRLNCSLEALHESVQRADFAFFEVDLATAHGKGEVLAEMARAIKAPDWFGHNWDALADALGDLSWRKSPGYVLLLHGELPGDVILDDILKATVEFWKMHGKAFWVFFV